MVFVMTDMNFFRVSTVTYASLSGELGLADGGFAHELSEASCASGGAEVLTAGALSFRLRARVTSLTTIVTAPSPQMTPIQFQKILLCY